MPALVTGSVGGTGGAGPRRGASFPPGRFLNPCPASAAPRCNGQRQSSRTAIAARPCVRHRPRSSPRRRGRSPASAPYPASLARRDSPRGMFALMIQNHPHRTGPDFRRGIVRRLACHGSAFSRVGASGNPGAVHDMQTTVSRESDSTPITGFVYWIVDSRSRRPGLVCP
jgi:hypothetical protein